jgi:DNA-directed RNA polymerase subunit H (RpoH/RPB5)
MGLKPHDHIYMEISADGKELKIRKLQLPKLEEDDEDVKPTIAAPADSDIAAVIHEQKTQVKNTG